MKNRLIASAAALFAASLLAGCAGAGEPPAPKDFSPSTAEVEKLVAEGTFPKGFPKDAEGVRVIQQGDQVAASWKGSPIKADCVPSADGPGSYASLLLLMDVGIQETEKCGDVWQAVQADGSRIFWNSSRD
ncbi:hypothetical protein FB468_2349 [Leucobacter komagatae]|uniref:Lipoprotein n=1 Tax=Leucobacter komagatae TaxID=55969 RepID=A0A542Y8A6_9MICO|nr:hypothetical protein [Leucobacter komagatae]TQL44295.1 hypothetical protein FB468_2349 [Leucobacter komagatae]